MRKITGTLREDMCKHMTISRWIFLNTRNVSGRGFRAIQTHILCLTSPPPPVPPPGNRAVYGVMWKIIVEPGRSQMTIWRMRFACWMSNAADTHSDYVIIIIFPRQQGFREHAILFRCAFTLPDLLEIERNAIEAPNPRLCIQGVPGGMCQTSGERSLC